MMAKKLRIKRVPRLIPVNTAVPTQTGLNEVGAVQTLGNGTWTNSPSGYTKQWYRILTATSAIVTLTGETGNTYTSVLADQGNRVFGKVIATNGVGPSLPASSVASEIIASGSDLLPSTQTIPWGKKTLRGFGRHNLSYSGVGTLTISDDPSGLWTISNNKICLSGTFAAAPPALSASYEVEVTDGTLSSVVTIDVEDYTYHIDADNSDVQATDQFAYMFETCTSKNFGDTVKSRDGVFNPANTLRTLTPSTASRPTVRGGGPAIPTEPYYVYDIAHVHYRDPATYLGWVTYTCDNDYGANISNYRFDSKNLAAGGGLELGALYARFTKFGLGLANQYAIDMISSATVLANRKLSYVQVHANIGTGIRSTISGGSTVYSVFIYDNDFSRNNLPLNVLGYDMVFEGNHLHDNTTEDFMRHCMYSVNRRSRACWNYFYNKVVDTGGRHGDFMQGLYGTTTSGTNYTPFLNPSDTVDAFDCYGNIFVRGDPATTLKDGQGMFTKDVNDGIILNMPRYLGNIVVNAYARNGIYQVSGVDAVIAHNTLLLDYASNNPTAAAPGIDIHGAATSGGVIRDNLVGNTIFDDTVGGPSQDNNLVSQNTEAQLRDLMDDPDLGPSLNQGIAEVVRQLNAKAGGALLPVGQNKIGAVTSYIDFVNRTLNLPGVMDEYGLPTE
jgi:hypothetical protein